MPTQREDDDPEQRHPRSFASPRLSGTTTLNHARPSDTVHIRGGGVRNFIKRLFTGDPKPRPRRQHRCPRHQRSSRRECHSATSSSGGEDDWNHRSGRSRRVSSTRHGQRRTRSYSPRQHTVPTTYRQRSTREPRHSTVPSSQPGVDIFFDYDTAPRQPPQTSRHRPVRHHQSEDRSSGAHRSQVQAAPRATDPPVREWTPAQQATWWSNDEIHDYYTAGEDRGGEQQARETRQPSVQPAVTARAAMPSEPTVADDPTPRAAADDPIPRAVDGPAPGVADEPIPDYSNPEYANLGADELFAAFLAEERAANPVLREYDMAGGQ